MHADVTPGWGTVAVTMQAIKDAFPPSCWGAASKPSFCFQIGWASAPSWGSAVGADRGLWGLQCIPMQAGRQAGRQGCCADALALRSPLRVCRLQVSSPSLETEAVTAVPAPPGLQAAVPALLLCPPHQPGSPRRWQWFARRRNRPRPPRAACSPQQLPCPT